MTNLKDPVPTPRTSINYLFFGIYFAVIAFIHVFHSLLIEPSLSVSSYFFMTYALAQCALETLILILVAAVLNQFLPRSLNFFALIVFFLFLSHIIDFPLVRLMDMSFWYALNFILQESYENFIELLLASNVSIFVWILAGISGLLILFSGIFFFRLSDRLSTRRPLLASMPMITATLFAICLFLITWDYGMRNHVSATYFDRYQKILPWKNTFFPHKVEYLTLGTPLPELETQEELMNKLDSRVFSLARKPDIYLFIIESLREDYINPVNAPNLHRFGNDHVRFDLALSNANATHVSWFSLFHSHFPLYWGKNNSEEGRAGSIPLKLLKKMGYKIYVSSSARLSYYQMDQVIFGEAEHLADALFIPDDEDDEPYLRDQKAIDNLLIEMGKEGSGRVFIVFLDATHLDYSWPKDMTRFYPIENKINYFKAAISRNGLEEIKNRYRNALYFVDTLFDQFLSALEKSPGGTDAVVVVTGDHGEEFYEHGNLFHASSLSHYQMHVPLYYRFGEDKTIKSQTLCKMTCHMDIFPTLFHYLIGEDLMGEVLQGESIFNPQRWPYTVVARFNASRSPTEFCIHNGTCKLIAEFSNERDIFRSKNLRILSTKNCRDENLVKEVDLLHEEFGPAFDRVFSKRRSLN